MIISGVVSYGLAEAQDHIPGLSLVILLIRLIRCMLRECPVSRRIFALRQPRTSALRIFDTFDSLQVLASLFARWVSSCDPPSLLSFIRCTVLCCSVSAMPRGTRRTAAALAEVEANTGNESETTENSENTNTSHVYIGNSYLVTWRNGQVQPATIIDRRPVKKKHKHKSQEAITEHEPEIYEYYVHYTNYDRRLDEWVTVDRIDLETTCNETDNGDSSPRAKASTKKMKRKLEDISGAPSQREEKLALLSNLEKEYEEITKVKNIQTIEMGKFEIGKFLNSIAR